MFGGLGIDKEFLDSGATLDIGSLGSLNGIPELINRLPSDMTDGATDVFRNAMGEMLDIELWLKIVQLQKDFNSRVAPGWEKDTNQEKFNYWMAIMDETVEVLGSKHWKWWKDTDRMNAVDWDNVQVELIDLFHFILSIALQYKMQDTLFMQLAAFEKISKGEGNISISIKDTKFFDDFWQQFLMAVWQKNLALAVVKWTEFFYRSGGTYLTLARDYFIKNALNHIRQEFGYSRGQYSKMWKHPTDPSKIVEDNVVAGLLLQES